MMYVADRHGNLHREGESVIKSRFVKTGDGRILLKSKKVQSPGKRGGKYWIDKQGNVRYGEKPESNKTIIDDKISEKYNIGPYGNKGFEIQLTLNGERSKIKAVIFNSEKTKEENWKKAVEYAKLVEKKDKKYGGNHFFSKSLSKSLEFSISGKELISGIKSRIEDIKKQIKILKELDTKDNSPQWKEDELKRLENILSNVDSESSYNLSPYELEEYGLLKSMDQELIKSLEFEISGQRIKDSIILKVSELRNKLETMKELFNNQKPINNTNQPDDVVENNPEAKDIAMKTISEWEIESLERTIKELEREARNIDVKKKFKLSSYDLKTYGL